MYLAELGLAGLVLPSPSLGLPSMPPPSPVGFRGVAIYWLALALPTTDPNRRFAPTVPVPTWGWAGIRFSSLSTDRVDRAPQTVVERDAYVRLAAAMAVAGNSLSQQSTLLWEVCLPAVGTAAFRGRMRPLGSTGLAQKSGNAAPRAYSWGTWDMPPIFETGTAAFRVGLRPLGITGLAQQSGVLAFRGSLRAASASTPTNMGSPVAFRTWTWATWGPAPVLSITQAGQAACRVRMLPLAITGQVQKRGPVIPRARVLFMATVDPAAHSATASFRAQVQ